MDSWNKKVQVGFFIKEKPIIIGNRYWCQNWRALVFQLQHLPADAWQIKQWALSPKVTPCHHPAYCQHQPCYCAQCCDQQICWGPKIISGNMRGEDNWQPDPWLFSPWVCCKLLNCKLFSPSSRAGRGGVDVTVSGAPMWGEEQLCTCWCGQPCQCGAGGDEEKLVQGQ